MVILLFYSFFRISSKKFFLSLPADYFPLNTRVQSSREGYLPYSPREPCAALAVYFLCTGLRNRVGLSPLLARRALVSEPINRFDDEFHLGARVQSSREGYLPYSPREPCAALAAYFLCTGLRIKKELHRVLFYSFYN